MQDLITVPQLAEIFGLKTSYIYKMIYLKKLPHYKPFGKQVYFKVSELNEMVENSKVFARTPENSIKDLADKHMMR